MQQSQGAEVKYHPWKEGNKTQSVSEKKMDTWVETDDSVKPNGLSSRNLSHSSCRQILLTDKEIVFTPAEF